MPLTLTKNAVHVWQASLNVAGLPFDRLYATLSPDEVARAGRFRFSEHRDRFIVAHGALRDILSRYLEVPADQLVFSTNDYGKPALATPEYAWLQFNLSHSGDVILFAVARDRPVGIDIERKIPPDNFPWLVAQFFSANENAAFCALPESQREAAFFAGWTRKEAYVKALGEGVTLPLNQFDVTMGPDGPARLLADRRYPHNPACWSLLNLDLGPDCAAALAVQGSLPTITFLQWHCP